MHLSYMPHYPTPGCEKQWIWTVVSKAVDAMGPILDIGHNTLICISVARGVYMFMTFMSFEYLATPDLLLMPNIEWHAAFIYFF